MQEILEEFRPKLEEIHNHLQLNPEVSWQEYKTTSYIVQTLKELGIESTTFDDMTGLVVEIGKGDTCVAVRTDIDALWQEVDGVERANHSCGHDGHMTIAIGVLLIINKLKRIGNLPNGRIKVIFQPAEEKGNGALRMMDKGILNDVHYLYGVHLRPIQELPDGYFSPSIQHGAAKFIHGEIVGEDAHGARPHLGQNSIEIGSSFIQALQNVHLDPMTPYSAKFTKFQAGGDSTNIIPGKASFSIDIRAQTNDCMEQLTKRIEDISSNLANLYNVKINLKTTATLAAAQINEEAESFMKQAIIDTVGSKYVTDRIVTTGGEDFHFYTLKNKNIKGTMLGLGCGLTPGLHHPSMNYNREQLFTGIKIMTRVVLNTLQQLNKEKEILGE